MSEFLNLLPPGLALQRLLSAMPDAHPAVEALRTPDALGRVAAEAVRSGEDLPGFSRSTVDGYALRAGDTFGASDSLPAYLQLAGEVPMGGTPAFRLLSHQAALVYTGGMLPEGADAVVMVEHTQIARPGELEILRAVARAENILLAGEDARRGDGIL